MSGAFVDSSQADMLLDLLRANEEMADEPQDALGVGDAVGTISSNFKEMIAAMLGQRCTVSVNSVGLMDGPWLEPQTDDQGCVSVSGKSGGPVFYLGMRNEQLRVLSGLFLGGTGAGTTKNEAPLSKSEQKILAIVADRLVQKLYTARDSLEAMPLPGSAVTCEPVQALDQVQGGQELVQVVIDTKCGAHGFRCTLLFAIEVLQPAAEPLPGEEANRPEETAHAHHHTARSGIDLGIIPSSATCELISTELSLAQIRRLAAGQMLPVEVPIRNVRLLDAGGEPFLTGRLVPAGNNRLQMIAVSDGEPAHGGVVR